MDDILQLASKIATNELILKNLFLHCDDETIRKCLMVSRQWNYIARIVIKMKRKVIQYISVFFLDRFRSFYDFQAGILNIVSPTVKRCYNDFVIGNGLKGTEAFENKFLFLVNRSYCQPNCVILMEGNNVKVGEKQCWTRNRVLKALRPSLPHDCTVIGIDAHHGILGESSATMETNSKDPLTLSYDISGLFGISGIVFPKYEGITITTFSPISALDGMDYDFKIATDVKALIILSSDPGFTSRHLLTSSQANSIFDHYQGQLALGGAQINARGILRHHTTTYLSNDEANFYFINGPPPYNTDHNPEKVSPITIQFSGPDCQAASLHISQLHPRNHDQRRVAIDELAYIEALLLEFRSNLTFPCDSTVSNETIGFLFFDYDCYRIYTNYTSELNSGIDLFFKVFPRTLITGVVCHSTYEHNYIPGINNPIPAKSDGTKTNLFPNRGIASFVLINLKKRINI